jgi:hypothetical protein
MYTYFTSVKGTLVVGWHSFSLKNAGIFPAHNVMIAKTH